MFWTDAFLQGASNNIFGNAFYRNPGQAPFEEISQTAGVETYWPWGVSVGDLNADGWEDILVTAGMGYPFRYAINSVLLNEQGHRFFDAEFLVGVEPRAGGQIDREIFEDEGRDLGREAFVPRGGSSTSSIRSIPIGMCCGKGLQLVRAHGPASFLPHWISSTWRCRNLGTRLRN